MPRVHVLLTLLTGLCIQARGGAPRIEFDKIVYDFGRITGVESVTARFAFTNSGDSTLNLGRLTTSCGCTEATAKPETLAPGQSGEIVFTVKMTSGRSEIKNHIYVPSNDPANTNADLMVRVDYVPLYETEPVLLNLDLRASRTNCTAVKVRRTDGKPLSLVKLEPSKPWIKAAFEPGTRLDAAEARILIEAKPDGPARYYTEVVRLFTDGQAEPVVMAILMGHIDGEEKAAPTSRAAAPISGVGE
jgi:hypothetical protein